METTENCANCKMRAKYDTNPKSFGGRFWRWHINWCPGWKKYMASLDDVERKIITEKYNIGNKRV